MLTALTFTDIAARHLPLWIKATFEMKPLERGVNGRARLSARWSRVQLLGQDNQMGPLWEQGSSEVFSL